MWLPLLMYIIRSWWSCLYTHSQFCIVTQKWFYSLYIYTHCPFLSFYLHCFSKPYLCLDVLHTTSQASHMGNTMPLFVDWYQETSPCSQNVSLIFFPPHYALTDLFGDFVSMALNLIPSLTQTISTHDRGVQHTVHCSQSRWQFVRWYRCTDVVPSYDFLFMLFYFIFIYFIFFAAQIHCIYAP